MNPDAALLFLAGLVSTLGQIVLLREVGVAFHGNELTYLIAIGVWMPLVAVGSGIGSRNPSAVRIAFRLMALASFLPLGVALLRADLLILAELPDPFPPFSREAILLLLALLPSGLFSGLLFREAAARYLERGRTLAGAYGIQCAGGAVGGLIATVAFRYGIQNVALALLCSLMAVAFALLLLTGRGNRFARAVCAALAMLLIGALSISPRLDRHMTGWNNPGLIVARESPYGRIVATTVAGQLSVFRNGTLSVQTGGSEAQRFAHLAALQHPEPRRILVLGGGLDGELPELLRHHPVRLDVVLTEHDPDGLIRRRLPAETRASLAAPAVRVSRADPRLFLKQSGFAWDLILVGLAPPTSGETNRLYTRELFMQCAARLHPGGIVALRLPFANHSAPKQTALRAASVYQALSSVFPERLVLPSTPAVMTASAAQFPRSAGILTDRLRERRIRDPIVTPSYLRSLMAEHDARNPEKRLQDLAVFPNTDVRPFCYLFALVGWLEQGFPGIVVPGVAGMGGSNSAAAAGWILGIGLLILFITSRLHPGLRKAFLSGVRGFLGMAGLAVLILAYQAREGLLYRDIGLLLAAFMFGQGLGALVIRDLLTGTGAWKRPLRRWGIALLAGFGIVAFTATAVITGGAIGDLWLAAGLLVSLGFPVGGLFAHGSITGIRVQQKAAGSLYTAGQTGGSLGAILGGVVLISLFGFTGALAATILLAAFALLLI